MMKRLIIASTVVIFAMGYYFVNAKSGENGRWYTKAQVLKGKKLFAVNCASCHGLNAQKTENWRQKLADGSYPLGMTRYMTLGQKEADFKR